MNTVESVRSAHSGRGEAVTGEGSGQSAGAMLLKSGDGPHPPMCRRR